MALDSEVLTNARVLSDPEEMEVSTSKCTGLEISRP